MTKPRTNPWMGGPCPDCEAHREEIKALEAQVRELEGRQKGEVHWLERENVDQHIRSLEAENKRLREPACDCLIHGLHHRKDCPRKP